MYSFTEDPQSFAIVRMLDVIIGISYVLIPIQIIFYGHQIPSMTIKHKMTGMLFAMFILICGLGHIIDAFQTGSVVIFLLRLTTAIVSIATSASIWIILPRVVSAVEHKRQLEISLEYATNLQTAVLDSSPYILIAVSPSGWIRLANRVALQKLRWDHGRRNEIMQIFSDDQADIDGNRTHAESFLARFADGRERHRILVDNTGARFPVFMSITEITYCNTPNGYLVVAVDISTIQRLRVLLEKAELYAEQDRKTLFRIIQMAPVSMAAFDRNMTYIESSPRWKEELPVDDYSSEGVTFHDTVLIPEEWSSVIENCLKDGETCTSLSGSIRIKKTGKITHVHWAISPWFTENQSSRENGVVMVIETVQDLVLEKEAALAASEQKSSFLANMSHELRTPLNGIIGFTDILIKELSSSAEANGNAVVGPETCDLVQSIKVSGESLLTLVNDILDFSKIEAGKMDIDPRPFSLRICIQNVCNLFEYAIRKKGLVFTTAVADDIIDLVLADDSRLRQILLNLTSNALKFTDVGNIHLNVSTSRLDPTLIQFDVNDTGIGIAGDRVPSLFISFAQAGASTSRTYGGTGLGLAISKKLAIMMGGTMWGESTPGQGSTFSFTVKLPPTDISFSHTDNILHSCNNFASKKIDLREELMAARLPLKILAAEDNIINTKLLRAILTRMGYVNTTFVADGRRAVEETLKAAAENAPYDIVLMDVQMPVMSGFDATKKIREIPYIKQPKIVAVTASVLRDELNEAAAVGMDDHVSKPLMARAIHDLFIKHFDSRFNKF